MIEVHGLTKRYGRTTVVDAVSFDVPPGDAVALWGPNGAGKTTVLRCLLGLTPYAGRVTVGGYDVQRQGKRARALVGYVPQELSMQADLTVVETAGLAAALRRVPPARTAEVLDLLSLGDRAGTRVGELSGGMKQRLGIAVALLADPPVLFLDEPTANLDAASRERTLDLIDALRTPDRTIVLTSHHLQEVGMLVERVVAMDDGRVVEECDPATLAERLGLRAWLHVDVVADRTDDAVATLVARGFAARRNAHGLLVEVAARDKAVALRALYDGGFGIHDFEVWR